MYSCIYYTVLWICKKYIYIYIYIKQILDFIVYRIVNSKSPTKCYRYGYMSLIKQ